MPEPLASELAGQMWALVGQAKREEAPGPSGNKIDFNLLHHVAKALGDPDAEYPLLVRDGVPLGITPRGGENPMPRTASIYEEKRKNLARTTGKHWPSPGRTTTARPNPSVPRSSSSLMRRSSGATWSR